MHILRFDLSFLSILLLQVYFDSDSLVDFFGHKAVSELCMDNAHLTEHSFSSVMETRA